MDDRVVSYAQNREDIILSAFFLDQPTGFYVDVGANDPAAHSVTKYFYDRGWRGVNIEPSPNLYKKLVELRPRDINLNVGASNKKGKLEFREYEGHGLSTFSEITKKELNEQKHPLTAKYTDYEVAVERLDDMLTKLGTKVGEIDFLKIDVEGYEYEVVDGNNWSKYRPKVICVEANHIQKDWPSLLEKADYNKVFNDGLNDYYLDSKRKDIEFKYIEAAIGRDITPAYNQDLIQGLEVENKRLGDEVRLLHNENLESQDEIDRLNNYLLEHSRLKNLLKDLAKKIHSIITVRLTNEFKAGKRYPSVTVSETETDPEVILASLKVADQKVFTRRPALTQQARSNVAHFIYWIYVGCARLVAIAARLMLRAIRRLK